jgi:hypothetical protein
MPAEFPVAISDIGAEGQAIFDAVVHGDALAPGNTYLAQVEAEYTSAGRRLGSSLTFSLVISPSAPGSGDGRTGRVAIHQISDRDVVPPESPRPQRFEPDSGRTSPVPTDPFVSRSRTKAVRTETRIVAVPGRDARNTDPDVDASLSRQKPERPKSNDVNFLPDPPVFKTGWLTAEPSGAVDSTGDVVFVTGNFFAAYSANGGQSFSYLDPDSIFPPLPVGWCDQVVRYAPSVDRFVWVRMFDAPQPVLRVATAKPADIVNSQGMAGWTYWDILPQSVGTTGFDYPDLSVGDNYVYLSYNNGGPAVIRMPLSQIDGPSQYLDFVYTNPGLSQGQSRLCQTTGDEIFWAVTTSTQSMRVFSWKESDGLTYWWRDVATEPWSTTHPTSLTPDGKDWLNDCAPGNVLGLTRRRYVDVIWQHDEVWFAWTAGSDPGLSIFGIEVRPAFEQAHVEVVVLDRNDNFNLITQEQIWTNNNAYAYPALCTNSNGDVGLSLEAGGGPGGWENWVVGIWGDAVLYVMTSSNWGCTRFGDFVTICRNAKDPSRFDAFGYGVMAGKPSPEFLGYQLDVAGVVADIRYNQFGR